MTHMSRYERASRLAHRADQISTGDAPRIEVLGVEACDPIYVAQMEFADNALRIVSKTRNFTVRGINTTPHAQRKPTAKGTPP